MIDELQLLVRLEATRRWPRMTEMSEGLALAEEAGEVCRAILKRWEGTRGTEGEWTVELRKELGQVLLVVLNVASMEGILASELLAEAWESFKAKPEHEPMGVE